jgi:hypothetical protein
VAGDVERRDTARTNNDSKKGGAIFIRGGEETLTPSTPDITKDRVASGDSRFLDERNVPHESGQVSPPTFQRGDVNGQNHRARARAGGLADEDLPAVASLRAT